MPFLAFTFYVFYVQNEVIHLTVIHSENKPENDSTYGDSVATWRHVLILRLHEWLSTWRQQWQQLFQTPGYLPACTIDTAKQVPIQSNIGMHHCEYTIIYKSNSLQERRLWVASLASISSMSNEDRSSVMLHSQVEHLPLSSAVKSQHLSLFGHVARTDGKAETNQ